MIKLKTSYLIAGAVIATAVAFPLASFAQSTGQGLMHRGRIGINRMMPGKRLVGTVTTVGSATLTVTDSKGTVYTVDASTAKIGEATESLSLANILVGDKVMITGTITGTNDAAKMINDSSMLGRNIFNGTVTATSVSGLTIDTMVNKTKTSYTVDTSAATFTKGMGKSSTGISIADVKVGDRITILGSLSGTNVTATMIRDMGQFNRRGGFGMKNKMTISKPANMFMGTVTASTGSTITITGMNKTVYTVDASAATLTKGMGKTSTTMAVADIKIGDRISAVGAVNGTNVVATSVRDLGQFKPSVHGHRGSGQK